MRCTSFGLDSRRGVACYVSSTIGFVKIKNKITIVGSAGVLGALHKYASGTRDCPGHSGTASNPKWRTQNFSMGEFSGVTS